MNNSAYRLTKTQPSDYRTSPSGSTGARDPNIDLRTYLDTHKDARSLRLADMSFGDDGAATLAEFLEKNKKIESLELRAAGITSDGFGKIASALVGNNVIKTLSAEWNTIGSGIRGFEALAEFLA